MAEQKAKKTATKGRKKKVPDPIATLETALEQMAATAEAEHPDASVNFLRREVILKTNALIKFARARWQ